MEIFLPSKYIVREYWNGNFYVDSFTDSPRFYAMKLFEVTQDFLHNFCCFHPSIKTFTETCSKSLVISLHCHNLFILLKGSYSLLPFSPRLTFLRALRTFIEYPLSNPGQSLAVFACQHFTQNQHFALNFTFSFSWQNFQSFFFFHRGIVMLVCNFVPVLSPLASYSIFLLSSLLILFPDSFLLFIWISIC